ncbi:MAG TPA: hypothetical protein VEP73_02550 [Actinomycetota bacterium]|nr:hypothetical protein [Actinomycetota bacterium]
MKYMILLYGSQQDYDGLAGKATDKPAWSAEDVAAMSSSWSRSPRSWWSPGSSLTREV